MEWNEVCSRIPFKTMTDAQAAESAYMQLAAAQERIRELTEELTRYRNKSAFGAGRIYAQKEYEHHVNVEKVKMLEELKDFHGEYDWRSKIDEMIAELKRGMS